MHRHAVLGEDAPYVAIPVVQRANGDVPTALCFQPDSNAAAGRDAPSGPQDGVFYFGVCEIDPSTAEAWGDLDN
jgi:hypothetical protein